VLISQFLGQQSATDARRLVDVFRASIRAVQAKLKQASRVAIDQIFDDGYSKLSQFGWIRKLWHVMIEFDPVGETGSDDLSTFEAELIRCKIQTGHSLHILQTIANTSS
jgi:hypothetical protein